MPSENFPAPKTLSAAEHASEHHAIVVLEDLGLDFEYLRNKLILDIGAGAAEVAVAAQEQGIEVVSVDINPQMYEEQGIPIPDVPYVKASAEQLPFADKTFDVIISHAGPFTIIPSKESVARMIVEARRVLKDDGELRFGPGNLHAGIFDDDELWTAEEEESLSPDERVQQIRQKSLEFLQSVDPDIIEAPITRPQQDGMWEHFYILRKTNDE